MEDRHGEAEAGKAGVTKRPDGKRLMLVGKTAFSVGVLTAVANALSFLWRGVLDYYPVSEMLTWLTVIGTVIGPIAWMTGYVVYAISFIPGRED